MMRRFAGFAMVCLAAGSLVLAGCGSDSTASAPSVDGLVVKLDALSANGAQITTALESCVPSGTLQSAAEARCIAKPYAATAAMGRDLVAYLGQLEAVSSGQCLAQVRALADAYRPLVKDLAAISTSASAGNARTTAQLLASPVVAQHSAAVQTVATKASGETLAATCS